MLEEAIKFCTEYLVQFDNCKWLKAGLPFESLMVHCHLLHVADDALKKELLLWHNSFMKASSCLALAGRWRLEDTCSLDSVGNLQAEVALGKGSLGKCHFESQKLS